ncbi:hypothetical protein PN462_05300 [Spirulina sp. CS-785/01]|uniref:hypothetical protein n=1 Tax=Spirulina sp. CS-785/01 TaxID=3021716 RepID=UPI00232BA64F|nr:hypothetical protein [Spirulina sp. CS-785/01]MDB9312513.1 hypothetical protein [Spirulina sp. CS-785/01]
MQKFSFFWRYFCSIWLVYLFHFRHLAAGSDRFVLLVMSLVEHGTIQLDQYVQSSFYHPYTGDTLLYQGHSYINVNPGTSFLATPFWAIFNGFYQQIPISLLQKNTIHFFLAHFVSFASTTAVFGSLTACLITAWVHHKTEQLWRGILGGLLYSFGSIAFFFSTRLNQNIPIAFITLVAFILFFDPTFLKLKNNNFRYFLIGLLLGIGSLIDSTILPFLGIFVILIISQAKKHIKPIILAFLGLLCTLSIESFYNFLAFKNPFLSAGQVFAQTVSSENKSALSVINFHFSTFIKYTFSPEAGLFLYLPYTLLAVWYLFRYRKEQKILSPLAKLTLIALGIGYFLFIMLIPPGYMFSLFGPRYLLPLIPFICIIVASYLSQRELQLTIILIAFGFFFNLAGAQLGNDTGNLFITVAVYIVHGLWFPVLTWIQTELTTISNFSPETINPLGLLTLLITSLVVLWLPYSVISKQ